MLRTLLIFENDKWLSSPLSKEETLKFWERYGGGRKILFIFAIRDQKPNYISKNVTE